MRALLACILVATVLAGCSDSKETPATDTTVDTIVGRFDAVRALAADLPCEADVPRDATSGNLAELATLDFEAGQGQELDIRGTLALSADYAGLATIDITDPLNPKLLAEVRDLAGGYDVKFLPDNKSAVLGHGNGILVVDLRDPTAPVVESDWSFSSVQIVQDPVNKLLENAHMLYTARIADADWVFVAPNTNSGVWILRVVGEPGGRTLEYVSQTLPLQGGPLGPHDMWVTYDTMLSAWLLYTSDGYHGWNVFNVDDPASPMLVGGINRPETGYTHTVQAEIIDGRRIVATIQEVGVNFLEVYDATDLRAPVLLATWQSTPGSAAMQHNFQIVNGTLYMAHYNQGIWVFDLRDAGTIPVVGTTTLAPVGHYGDGSLAFWDVVVDHGVVYGSAMDTNGFHVVAYGCNTAGDPLLTSTG